MPRVCTICRHPERKKIDRIILQATDSLRDIGRQFEVAKDAVVRHRDMHLPQALVKAEGFREYVHSESLLDQLKKLKRDTLVILHRAQDPDEPDSELALKAIDRIERQLEFEARLLGELDDAAKIAVGIQLRHESKIEIGGVTATDALYGRIAELSARVGPERIPSKPNGHAGGNGSV